MHTHVNREIARSENAKHHLVLFRLKRILGQKEPHLQHAMPDFIEKLKEMQSQPSENSIDEISGFDGWDYEVLLSLMLISCATPILKTIALMNEINWPN